MSEGNVWKRKRLLYRMRRRGMKELELLLADVQLHELSPAEQSALEEMLELPEPLVWARLRGLRNARTGTGHRGREDCCNKTSVPKRTR